jgi:uncharacterized protein (TIGR00299 family) protein
MILGALIGLGANLPELLKILSAIPFEESESFEIAREEFSGHGIKGFKTFVRTEPEHHPGLHHRHHHDQGAEHHHPHRTFADIKKMLEESELPKKSLDMAVKTFRLLAEAEGAVHGMEPDKVHFHEVGAMDSIIDIAGSCLALDMLGAESVSVSPLPTGRGVFQCRHGVYPLPAPATAILMKNLEMTETNEPYELVTPTAAALFSAWNKTARGVPMKITAVANSFGHRTLDSRPNLLRASLLESASKSGVENDTCVLLETNIDDSSPEITGALFNRLLKAGALDVFLSPVIMKKQRPGVILSVLCRPEDKNKLAELIFRESSTFGIRESEVSRRILQRELAPVTTPYGEIRVKTGFLNGERVTVSPELDDCAAAAEKHGVTLKTVITAALAAAGH